MTNRGCELWPRAPFCVSRFLSRVRIEGCGEGYLILSGHGMREELLPWRKTSYCRCHELKCSAICFRFQLNPHSLSAPISLKTDTPSRPYSCVSADHNNQNADYSRGILHSLHVTSLESKASWLHDLSGYSFLIFRLISAWHRIPQYIFIQG